MKKNYTILSITCLLFYSVRSFSQSFTVAFPDTVAYGEAVTGAALSCWVNNYVTNHSGASIDIDIVRVQDDCATPGWTSAFCFKACQSPDIDSLRSVLSNNDSVNMAVHLIVTNIPDSGTVLMKLKNVSNPSNIIYQRFYGVSRLASAVSQEAEKKTSVKIYPSPVLPGRDFSMYIANVQNTSNEITLVVYNIYGSRMRNANNLRDGINTLSFDLPAGIYSYTLTQGAIKFYSGKLIVTE